MASLTIAFETEQQCALVHTMVGLSPVKGHTRLVVNSEVYKRYQDVFADRAATLNQIDPGIIKPRAWSVVYWINPWNIAVELYYLCKRVWNGSDISSYKTERELVGDVSRRLTDGLQAKVELITVNNRAINESMTTFGRPIRDLQKCKERLDRGELCREEFNTMCVGLCRKEEAITILARERRDSLAVVLQWQALLPKTFVDADEPSRIEREGERIEAYCLQFAEVLQSEGDKVRSMLSDITKALAVFARPNKFSEESLNMTQIVALVSECQRQVEVVLQLASQTGRRLLTDEEQRTIKHEAEKVFTAQVYSEAAVRSVAGDVRMSSEPIRAHMGEFERLMEAMFEICESLSKGEPCSGAFDGAESAMKDIVRELTSLVETRRGQVSEAMKLQTMLGQEFLSAEELAEIAKEEHTILAYKSQMEEINKKRESAVSAGLEALSDDIEAGLSALETRHSGAVAAGGVE
jgi:hypothetical protein